MITTKTIITIKLKTRTSIIIKIKTKNNIIITIKLKIIILLLSIKTKNIVMLKIKILINIIVMIKNISKSAELLMMAMNKESVLDSHLRQADLDVCHAYNQFHWTATQL